MNVQRNALGGFRHAKDEDLLVRGSTVLQAMSDNDYFPEPMPPLPDLEAVLLDFQSKLAASRRRGGPQDTAAKNASREQLESVLKRLAFYVSNIALGDLQVLLSSGFVLSGTPRSGDVPDVVRGVALSDGRQSGQLRLDFNPIPASRLYEYRYTHVREGVEDYQWEQPMITSSSRANIIAPVIPFKRYYVQVRAVNGYGKSDWSETVSHVVR